jgi:hypothetical protein
MKKKNKHGEPSEFIRYIRGEMTKREENAFQRQLQKDPFAEEADEGYSEISADQIVSDLEMLEKRIKTRITGRQRMIYYRIAASVAVLMIISSVFLIINRNKPARELSKVAEAPQAAPEPDVSEEMAKTEIAEEIKDKGQIAAGPAISDSQLTAAAREPVLSLAEARAVKASLTSLKKSALVEVRGTVISSEDNLPVPGAVINLKGTNTSVVTDNEGKFSMPVADTAHPVLVANFIGMEQQEIRAREDTDMKISLKPSEMALNEVMVVGYGGEKTAKAVGGVAAEVPEYDKSGYSSAQPESGKQNYDRYIENNIHNPASLPPGQRAVVVLNFLVKSTGIIDSIKVIRSPGQEFSDEAIRLIREGPAWEPATENGKTITEDVRIRIVFK